MKGIVIPVRWQCAKCWRWYCGNQPSALSLVLATFPFIFLLIPPVSQRGVILF
ncbi:TPA: hypothetical protein ACNTIF_004948 [Escherichia coli]|nr:hypothetical protein [Escherichia coli]HBH4733699.1 hypothetical protein [Escherichia coli]HBL0511107.1 hypothetical protein [Escherichia coli]HBN0899690.1 hypothetical protein [Escherichia coli]HDK8918971.1 hypothetical protein [Escherichia coli]